MLLALVAPAGVGASGATLGPGSHRIELLYGGLARSYIVHVPPQSSAGGALPAVLNFHGASSNAQQQERYSAMDAAADRDGFPAVYPNGTGRGTRALTWNAGGCCAWAERNRIHDVGFTRALLDDLAARVRVDRARVYATGISNGGMMAFRLGVEAADLVAAIAPVEGALMVEAAEPARAMPLMLFNSVNDRYVPYEGRAGLIGGLAHATRYLRVPGVDEKLARWRGFDGCPPAAQVGPELKGASGSADAGNTATRYEWGPCRDDSRIVQWKLSGSGHVWPGASRSVFFLGRGTRLIDANDQMWEFFRDFSLACE